MKREALSHTKMKRLCRRMDIPRYQAVGILEELWKLTEREAWRGDIGKLSNEDIALGIDFRGDEHSLVAALEYSGWLDKSDEHRFLIHDWWDHCEDMIHMRIARAHEYFADGRVPKLTRLGDRERASAHGFYFERTDISAVRTLCTPLHSTPLHSTPPVSSSAVVDCLEIAGPEVSEPPPLSQELPKGKIKTFPSPKPPTAEHKAIESRLEVYEFVKSWLIGYPGADALPGKPDDQIVKQCLDIGNWDSAQIANALQRMAFAFKRPTLSWAWFPRVLAQYCKSRDGPEIEPSAPPRPPNRPEART